MEGKTKLLIEQVKNTTDVKFAIALLADVMMENQGESIKQNSDIQTEIKKITEILTGNGKPEISVCSRLANLEKRVNGIYAIFITIGTALVIYIMLELIKLV